MRVLSLGKLQSQLISDLLVEIPVELEVRLRRIIVGETGTTAIDDWLSTVVGGPMRLEFDLAVLPLPYNFRTEEAKRLSRAETTDLTAAAVPIAVCEQLIKVANVKKTASRDVMISGRQQGEDYVLTTSGRDWDSVKELARELNASLIGDADRTLAITTLMGHAFAGQQKKLVLTSLQVLLLTGDQRLRGDAVESYHKLNGRLISGGDFQGLLNNVKQSIIRAPEFLRVAVDLLKWHADLSRSKTNDAPTVIELLDEDIIDRYSSKYPVLFAQFYIDLTRYLQDIRGIDLSNEILARLASIRSHFSDLGLEPDLLFLADHRIGRSHYLRGQFVEALKCYQSAIGTLARFQQSDKKAPLAASLRLTTAEILNSAGKVFNDLFDFKRAMELFDEAVSLRQLLDANPAQAATLGSIAETLERLGHYEQAQALFKRDLAWCEEKDQLRVRNYIAMLMTLGKREEIAKARVEFEVVYEHYRKDRDFGQASYSAVGLAMCAYRESNLVRLEELWREWRGLGEGLPRGFITFLYGVARRGESDWDTAIEHIRRSAETFKSEGYLVEAAAAYLELMVIACIGKQFRQSAVSGDVDPSIVPRFLPSDFAREGLTAAIELIDQFQILQERSRELFKETPRGRARGDSLPEAQGLEFPDGHSVIQDIRTQLEGLRKTIELPETLDVAKVRQLQRQLHFWFDILEPNG
jgi:tetratricopeptide (TPR) repeat protein